LKISDEQNNKIAKMSFGTVYPLYVAKVERKGRTEAELIQVISWLTGLDEKQLRKSAADKANFESLFALAKLNPHAKLITGVICGYRVEDIDNPLTQKVRYMDKLVDELAKGKKMESILREP
jgi:hypothetical protein